MPELIDQLNRGQSAEVTNGDGSSLRLWVNPKERTQGVEPLVHEKRPAEWKRDYRRLAHRAVEPVLGGSVCPEELEALACSVARQWQQFGGHACLFLNGSQRLTFQLCEQSDGYCRVDTIRLQLSLEPLLLTLGIPPEGMSEVFARINLGQQVEFRDRDGVRSQ